MAVENGELPAVGEPRLSVAGIAYEDVGAFDPGSFPHHRDLALRAMERNISFEQFS